MDNTNYDIESGGAGEVDALRELGRVARRVLVTVPAGRDLDMGWQRQYAPSTFRRVVEQAGLGVDSLQVFVHDPVSGWSPTAEDWSPRVATARARSLPRPSFAPSSVAAERAITGWPLGTSRRSRAEGRRR